MYEPRQGWIYFAQKAEGGPIKIGYTERQDPWNRLESSPFRIGAFRLLGVLPGSRFTERQIHTRFQAYALGKEWFRSCPELMALIADCQHPDGPPLRKHHKAAPFHPVPRKRKKPKPSEPFWVQDAIDLRREGKTFAEISKCLGLSRQRIHHQLNKHNANVKETETGRNNALPALPRHTRKHINENELRSLLQAAKDDVFDYALVTLMYNGALRASEVGMLTLGHARFIDQRKLYVDRVKGSHSTWLENIHPSAVRATLAWIDYRYPEKAARRAEDALFPSNRWRGLSTKGLSRWSVARAIRRLCHTADLPDIVAHPHSLRHGRVMHMLEAAARTPNFYFETLVPTLAQYLGHAAAKTTVSYYMHQTRGAQAVDQSTLNDIFDGEDASSETDDS